MAQATESLKELTDQYTEAVADSGNDTRLLAHCSDFLRHYAPPVYEHAKDTLDKIHIDLSARLAEFDTKNARAYVAREQSRDELRPLFALVCQKSGLQRYGAIDSIRQIESRYLMKLVACGTVRLSQPNEERFVLIYERPAGKKLSDLIAATKEPLNDQFICKQIIAPIASVIVQMAEQGITHGRIHPDNIYFSDIPVLGDCLSDPCGYSQPFPFEPLERLQSHPAGKGEGNASQDYYALGVTVLYMLCGPQHFSDFNAQKLAAAILKDGAYAALTKGKEMPDIFLDFFRGMLSQNPHERWGERFLKLWLDGKRHNVPLPAPPAEAIRPLEFGGAHIDSRRELAHFLYQEWSKIPAMLASGELHQWVTISLRDKDLAEQVARIARTVADTSSKNQIQIDEQLMRLILLFDPAGPTRLSPLSFHIDGIPSLVAELINGKTEKELPILSRYVELNMASFWLEVHRKARDFVLPLPINDTLVRLDRLRVCIRNPGMGFGIERMLYDLNPSMPCQSPLCGGEYINTLPALLIRLDRIAATAKDQEPVDRHIAAFIASKLSIQHEIKLHDFNGAPALASHRSLLSLRLLAMAQQRTDGLSLPGLTHWLTLKALPQLDHIRSRSLRQEVKASAVKVSDSGDLTHLSSLLIDSGYVPLDGVGFQQARQTYEYNDKKIASYRSGEFTDIKSVNIGGTISKLLGYLTLIITLINVAHHV